MSPKTWGVRASKSVSRFVVALTRYGALVERLEGDRGVWARRMLRAITELHAAGCALPPVEMGDATDALRLPRERWDRIHDALVPWLGDECTYFVCDNPEDPVARSGARDLADIYGDLKPGLERWLRGPSTADGMVVFEWRDRIAILDHHHVAGAMGVLRGIIRADERVRFREVLDVLREHAEPWSLDDDVEEAGVAAKPWSGVRKSKSVLRFVAALARYIALIERLGGDRGIWARRTLRAVTELHAAACALPPVELGDAEDTPTTTHEERAALYDALLPWLAGEGCYFICDDARHPLAGSGAWDVGDIYHNLKPGLDRWMRGPSAADTMIVYEWMDAFPISLDRRTAGAVRVLRDIIRGDESRRLRERLNELSGDDEEWRGR